MCLHETVQMTDEHRVIVCGDCGREFGHIGRDDAETFVAYVTPDHPVVLVTDEGAPIGLPFHQRDHQVVRGQPIYPCAKCGWAMSCDEDEGGCHT